MAGLDWERQKKAKILCKDCASSRFFRTRHRRFIHPGTVYHYAFYKPTQTAGISTTFEGGTLLCHHYALFRDCIRISEFL